MIYVVEINIICLFILVFTLSSVCSKEERQVSIRQFILCIVSAVICITADICFMFIESDAGAFLRNGPYVNYLVNLIYYTFDVGAAFFWFMYAEYSIDGKIKNSKLIQAVAVTPMAINMVLSIASFWTGTFFRINENNLYERGSLFFINSAICYLYIIFASVHAFIKSLRTTVIFKKKEYRIISAYILFPFVLGVVQIFYPDIPTVCLGMAIPILFVHIKLQDLKISTDYLTNMNNRNQLIRYLTAKIRTESENLYLFMMDVDKFKSINDNYGHTEGDNALVSVADKLKEVAREFGGIIARYGGDEFSFATEFNDEETAKLIKQRINEKMAEASQKHVFDIVLSVGYAKYKKGQKIVELIGAADEMLYKEKRAKKGTAR